MFENVEGVVSAHFNVTPEQIRTGGKSRDITDARHFIWYILHTTMGYNGKKIAREYKVTARNVYYSVAVIRDGIRTQPFYSKHLSDIQKELGDHEII